MKALLTILPVLVCPLIVHADDITKAVQKAVEQSTLNQVGTPPFHLRADVAPTRDSDKDSGRSGTVEIWWASPTKWRREVRSPQFHQIAIVDGDHEWQKNDGDYFPEWLRNVATELISPVPDLPTVLQRVRTGEVRRIAMQTNIEWEKRNGKGDAQANAVGYLALMNNSGLLFYCGSLGWDGLFKDFSSFHGQMIARKVSAGTPEVTANVTTLEDLATVAPDLLNANQPSSDPPIRTIFVTQEQLEGNLIPMAPTVWPPVQNGSLEGGVSTELTIDRMGHVREIGSIVSENQGVNEAGRAAYLAMQFRPILLNGQPVQATVHWVIPFKTTRPAGVETFDSARTFFERGRRLDFPAAGIQAYRIRAEFDYGTHSGKVLKGRYEDTWSRDSQWRREAWIGDSHFVRSRSGDKYYVLAEGDDVNVLRFVLKALEPLPALDTFVESDWRIQRDLVSGQNLVRVASGHEGSDGKLDPQSRGYWFDETGNLVQSHLAGFEVKRTDFVDFGSVRIARHIQVLGNSDTLAMDIRISEVAAGEHKDAATFVLKGHEWKRAFTDEVR